jgi:hypothetical protein
MLPTKFAAALLLALPAVVAAQMPLPELRIEPTAGGSIFYIKNNSSEALSAYLIELVDYPGSSYSLWQDETVAEPIPPHGEKRIQVSNMTVGAVPDYVKMQAALYASGTSAGVPEKIAQLIDRRRVLIETIRQLIGRLEKAQAEGTPESTVVAALKQWADTLQPQGKGNRNSPAAVNQAAARTLIASTAGGLDAHSLPDALTVLRTWDRILTPNTPMR